MAFSTKSTALKAVAGDYNGEDAKRSATLTTILIDEAGDYILENARNHEHGDHERLQYRPVRITFVVHGRTQEGEPTAAAIPAEVAFGNDDEAILENK